MNAGAHRQFSVEHSALAAHWTTAAKAMEALAAARSLSEVTEVLRRYARRVVGADGIAIALRDGDQCHYVAEDAIEPLWQGQRFPMDICVSGWAMRNGQTAVIPDVFADARVPIDAYRSTFVRAMLMVPIGHVTPVAAVGAYWLEGGKATENQIALLEALARSASTALENGRLFGALEDLNRELEQRVRERTVELEKSQENLRQVQKMEMLGQLTGHVAHDFNNLLTPIISSLDMILAGRRPPEALGRTANIAMQAAESAQVLVQRLLAFARRQPLSPTAVDLRELLEGMKALLASTLGPRIDFNIDAPQSMPLIHADRHQLELAILNLVVNGRDAMPEGGALTISASLPSGGRRPASLGEGEFVRLVISDTGVGMSPAIRASATEPFFTTKPAGHGTGLGLSMAHGLCGQLGGTLDIISEVGRGTQVELWLPVEKARATASGTIVPDMETTSESDCKVLLVDDNDLVRSGTREMLTDLGYEVVDTDHAERALTIITDGYRPEVVVTDHIMPGMTGAELALRLRADHPEIAVLIVSGYEGEDIIAPDVVRLSKPYRQKHLQMSITAAKEQAERLSGTAGKSAIAS